MKTQGTGPLITVAAMVARRETIDLNKCDVCKKDLKNEERITCVACKSITFCSLHRNHVSHKPYECKFFQLHPIEKKKDPKVCKVCGTAEIVQQCDACKSVFYCSQKHQQQDLPDHRNICRVLKNQKSQTKVEKQIERIHDEEEKLKDKMGTSNLQRTNMAIEEAVHNGVKGLYCLDDKGNLRTMQLKEPLNTETFNKKKENITAKQERLQENKQQLNAMLSSKEKELRKLKEKDILEQELASLKEKRKILQRELKKEASGISVADEKPYYGESREKNLGESLLCKELQSPKDEKEQIEHELAEIFERIKEVKAKLKNFT